MSIFNFTNIKFICCWILSLSLCLSFYTCIFTYFGFYKLSTIWIYIHIYICEQCSITIYIYRWKEQNKYLGEKWKHKENTKFWYLKFYTLGNLQSKYIFWLKIVVRHEIKYQIYFEYCKKINNIANKINNITLRIKPNNHFSEKIHESSKTALKRGHWLLCKRLKVAT